MKAIITRNDQTAVLELPISRMEIAGSLSRIGVKTPAYIIPCSDGRGRRLYQSEALR